MLFVCLYYLQMQRQGQGDENDAQQGDTRREQELEHVERVEEQQFEQRRWGQHRNQKLAAKLCERVASHGAETV